MRNGSRFSWLRSGRESLHARTPIAPREGDERVQLEKRERELQHTQTVRKKNRNLLVESLLLVSLVTAYLHRTMQEDLPSCQVLWLPTIPDSPDNTSRITTNLGLWGVPNWHLKFQWLMMSLACHSNYWWCKLYHNLLVTRCCCFSGGKEFKTYPHKNVKRKDMFCTPFGDTITKIRSLEIFSLIQSLVICLTQWRRRHSDTIYYTVRD